MDLEMRLAILERQVQALTRRSGTPFALARSTLPVTDTAAVQTVQAQLDSLSVRNDIPLLYSFGFTASPPVGSDLHVCFLDNERSQGVVVASGHQSYRMGGLQPGEAAIYDQWGNSVHLTGAGIVMTSSAAVQINAPALVASGLIASGAGATGTFTDSSGSTVTVADGIITNIS